MLHESDESFVLLIRIICGCQPQFQSDLNSDFRIDIALFHKCNTALCIVTSCD